MSFEAKEIFRFSPATLAAVLTVLVGLGACHPTPSTKPQVAATIPPLAFILTELVTPRLQVVTLLTPGASPHTYEISPADARAVSTASALFYVDDTLDGWGARLSAQTKVRVFDWVPADMRLEFAKTEGADDGHGHSSGYDPHFWSDPLIVKTILPKLTDKLVELDPQGAEVYRSNAARFAAELDTIDKNLREALEPVKGQAIVTFHPSWDYFLKRYGIRNVGVLEPSPGKEASPKEIMRLVESIHASGAKAVFSEPQLPSRPAQVLAETAGVKLGMLDPNGGVPGRSTYRELLEFNTKALKELLQ